MDFRGDYESALVIRRYYNSAAPAPAGGAQSVPPYRYRLGTGWQTRYDQGIVFNTLPTPSIATLNRPDGKIFSFTLNTSTNKWVPDADIADTLVQLTDGSGNVTGWRYTVAADDSVETYDTYGRLLTLADRAGRTQTLTYSDGTSGANGGYVLDASGNPTATVLSAALLIRVTDPSGRTLSFGYDATSRIVKLTDPAGGIYRYTYDASNNLTTVAYPDGHSKTYLYNEQANTGNTNQPHALTGITDENGARYATYRYDSTGRAYDEDHATNQSGGPVDHYNLAYGSNSTTVTDPLNTQRTYNFTTILGVVKSTGVSQPGGSGCSASSSAMTYDANGNIASRADFNGHQTCYAYDLARNLETARVEGLASGVACPTSPATYTPAANTVERKILTQWDSRFRLPVSIVEAGRETDFVYDSHGNVTSRSVKDLVSGAVRSRTTTYTYHATVPGVLVQTVEDGPRTDVADITTTDYYAPDATCAGASPLGCRGQVKQITNALGHVTHIDLYDANGRVLQTTDPNGLVTTLTYTPRGWLKTRTVGSETTVFDYDFVGQLTKLTRPDASYVSFVYDDAHRLTAIVDQDGGRLTYTLDGMGNRTGEAITTASGSAVYAHSRSFDALGRLWHDIGAYNQTVTYGYDAQGNLARVDGARTDVTDVTTYSYDALNRLTQTLNADNGFSLISTNALDQTTRIVDPANQITTLTVNAFGDTTKTLSADTGTTTRSFDTAGNLKSETDARGIVVSYSYDALNRVVTKSSSDTATPVLSYLYDQTSLGRLNFIQFNGSFQHYLNYDAQGRIAYQIDAIPGNSSNWVISLNSYDAYGRLSQIVYPTGRSVTYGYDANGRINQVTTQPSNGSPVTVLANTFSYGYPFNAVQSFAYGDGSSSIQNRDADYQPSAKLDGAYSKVYSYDPSGNLTRLNDVNTTTLTYGYDATGRLTSAIDSATNSFGSLGYSYDKNGNRRLETRNGSNLGYIYSPPSGNWLQQKGSDVRTKTPVSNLASSTALGSFTYDGYNRMLTSSTAAETTTYSYNGLGQRIGKINQNGLATSFVYGINGELLYEQDQAGNTIAYVWLDGRPLARIDNNATIYYYHVDHLGTPQSMTNATGTTVWQANYEPFGLATIKVNTVVNNLRLPGQYYDRETGLSYNYFRDYDSGVGRYVEGDPIGLAGGLNLYAYVGGNPISRIDPLGLMGGGAGPRAPEQISVGIGGCVGTACVGYNSRDSSSKLSVPFLPEVGGGISICSSPKKQPSSCPEKEKKCPDGQFCYPDSGGRSVNFGLGSHFGISLGNDGSFCVNIGLSLGSPISGSAEVGSVGAGQ
jgi:RHS repeat-associated protein